MVVQIKSPATNRLSEHRVWVKDHRWFDVCIKGVSDLRGKTNGTSGFANYWLDPNFGFVHPAGYVLRLVDGITISVDYGDNWLVGRR